LLGGNAHGPQVWRREDARAGVVDLGPGWQQVRVTFQDLGTAGEDVVGFLICATAPGGFAIEIADVRLWR